MKHRIVPDRATRPMTNAAEKMGAGEAWAEDCYAAMLAAAPPYVPSEADIEAVARAIEPDWFGEVDGVHALDEYPGQHKYYQERALEKARAAASALLKRMG